LLFSAKRCDLTILEKQGEDEKDLLKRHRRHLRSCQMKERWELSSLRQRFEGRSVFHKSLLAKRFSSRHRVAEIVPDLAALPFAQDLTSLGQSALCIDANNTEVSQRMAETRHSGLLPCTSLSRWKMHAALGLRPFIRPL
jgi:hypothetical protein